MRNYLLFAGLMFLAMLGGMDDCGGKCEPVVNASSVSGDVLHKEHDALPAYRTIERRHLK